ncbi:MAG: short chain dehydrogenase [Gammaproteobacteria bacterium HGW-Gammaproteobacteria-11]|nr:MAG: short chain dehydrogenase [Gammaproteobacteria bacterium HGW-Gammaproteobacteria-11]
MSALSGQVAVITGAASGIGKALAEDLAGRGCKLALADLNEQALAELAAELTKRGCQVITCRLDVADRAAVEAFANEVKTHFGRADLLFNNAGVSLSQTVEHTDYNDFEWLMNINFWGVVHGTKAFLPLMREQRSGHIINISSLFGLIGVPTQAAYNASKFAVRGFTEALRQELRGSGIEVSCVHPGGIKTNIMRNARFYVDTKGHSDMQAAVSQFDRIATTEPHVAAKVILDGVSSNKARILIGLDAKLLSLIQRLLPVGYQGLLGYFLKKS